MNPRLLVVAAVEAEAAAVRRGLASAGGPPAIDVIAGGVGMAAAAASTAAALTTVTARGEPYAAVLCAGIAGGFPGRAEVGSTVLAEHSVAADLGADSAEGFQDLSQLGFGHIRIPVPAWLLDALRAGLPEAPAGDVLTVATVTGTPQRAEQLQGRFPAALAEAMEGYGVAVAAQQAGVAFAELRTISNPVGARKRTAWRIDVALAALEAATAAALGEQLAASLERCA